MGSWAEGSVVNVLTLGQLACSLSDGPGHLRCQHATELPMTPHNLLFQFLERGLLDMCRYAHVIAAVHDRAFMPTARYEIIRKG